MKMEDIKLGTVFRIPPIHECFGDDIDIYCVLHYEHLENDPTVDVVCSNGIIYSGFALTQQKVEDWENLT